MAAGQQSQTKSDTACAAERLDEPRTRHAPDYRRQLTRVVMREVIRRTISSHPQHMAERCLSDVKQKQRNLVPNL